MQLADEQLEKAKAILTDKENKVNFPVLYGYATCVYAKKEGHVAIYSNSQNHKTPFYSVHPLYKLIASIDY